MKRIYDENKLDLGLFPQTVDTTSVIGEYFTLKNSNIVGCSVLLGNMADGSTAVCQMVQAKDAIGTDSKDITGATCTVTANTKVKAATITLATFTAGSVIVINGITFTAHASTTTPANREFSIAGTDTQDAAELVSLINDATYGVPGVTASNALGVITLVLSEPGEGTITAVGVVTIGEVATLQAGAYIEIPDGLLDVNNDFTHVALKITTDASIICASELIRESERYTPTQYFAAEYLG